MEGKGVIQMHLKLPVLTALIAVAAALSGGCTDKKPAGTSLKPIPVRTVEARAEDVTKWREVMGKIEGRSEIEVRSQVTGLLKKIAYGEGRAVKRGDLLFVVDPAPYEASLKEAKASEAEAEAKLEQAARELRRSRNLFAKKATTEKELDDAVSEHKVAAASLRAARALVENARVSLSYTSITAASNGVAGLSLIKPGALVTAQSTLLTTLTQTDDLRVVFALSDRDLGSDAITGDSAVDVADQLGRHFAAKLDYISQSVDSDLGTRQLRAEIPAGSGLLAGQFVRVRVQTGIERSVFKVPQASVMQESNGTYSVFVKRNGRAEKVQVTVGPWSDSDWLVRSGLADGDQVITTQILRLRTGREVTDAAPPENQQRQ